MIEDKKTADTVLANLGEILSSLENYRPELTTSRITESSFIIIQDLFSTAELNEIVKATYKATGIPSAFISPTGEMLTKMPETSIRASQQFCSICRYSDKSSHRNCFKLTLEAELAEKQGLIIATCRAGLLCGKIRIVAEKKQLAQWVIGQVQDRNDKKTIQLPQKQGVEDEEQILSTIPKLDKNRFIWICEALQIFGHQNAKQAYEKEKYKQRLIRNKEAEYAARENEKRYRILFESSNEAIFILTVNDCTFLTCNKRALDMFGVIYEDIINKTPLDPSLTPEYQPNGDLSTVAGNKRYRAAINGEPQYFEWVHKRKDGTEFYAEVSLTLFTLNTGSYLQVFLRDITNRKEVEKTLQESQDKFKAISNGTLDALIMMDNDGFISFWNKAAEKIFGYKNGEIIGKELHRILAPHKYHQAFMEGFRKYKDTGEGRFVNKSTDTMIALRKNGEHFPIEISLSRIEIDKKWHSIGIIRDITERISADEKSKKLQEKIREDDKMKAIGTLAGGMAHNINNLLMAIQANTSLILKDIEKDTKAYRRLKYIEQYVEEGASMTEQVLGYARDAKYVVEPTNINDIITRANELLTVTRKDVNIVSSLSKDIWKINADRGQIKQVVLNIYNNAWQAMPDGGDLLVKTRNIVIKEESEAHLNIEPGYYVELSVSDTGHGMEQSTIKRIFDPFFTTRATGQGTGLGLASAHGIIKSHAGYIHVESVLKKGTTFKIYLPITEDDEKDKANGDITKEAFRGTETILIVDDEVRIVEAAKEMLESLGYTALVAHSGKEALELFMAQKSKIDLIVLDLVMPKMNGKTTFKKLKMIGPDAKIIIASGYGIGDWDIQENGRYEAFIKKPFKLYKLSKIIRDVIDS